LHGSIHRQLPLGTVRKSKSKKKTEGFRSSGLLFANAINQPPEHSHQVATAYTLDVRTMTVVTSLGKDQLAGTAHSICTAISQWREEEASSNAEFLRIDASVRVKATELIYSINKNHDQPLKRCLAGDLN
jgi:hypothetical protein